MTNTEAPTNNPHVSRQLVWKVYPSSPDHPHSPTTPSSGMLDKFAQSVEQQLRQAKSRENEERQLLRRVLFTECPERRRASSMSSTPGLHRWKPIMLLAPAEKTGKGGREKEKKEGRKIQLQQALCPCLARNTVFIDFKSCELWI